MRTLSIETPTHGRVLIEDPSGVPSATVVAFHGYAQGADDLLAELKQIPGSDAWALVSVQALHRFYTRGDQTVVASWMTRQDREQAIADNIEYVDRVLDAVTDPAAGDPAYVGRRDDPACVGRPALQVGRPALQGRLFVLGFSQGAAMAYRAGLLGRHRVDGIIVVGGDVPPDVKVVPVDRWPRVLVAAGNADHWYTPDKVNADESFLRAHGVAHEILHYQAGHIFTDDVRACIASFVTRTS